MKDLIQAIVSHIVDEPDKIQINEIAGTATDTIEIIVSKSDLGKVIGKSGKTAHSIRNIIYAASFKTKKRYSVDIMSFEDREQKVKEIS